MGLLLLQESVEGLSHDTCEDYACVKEVDDYVVFAVADGHGSSSCIRSRVGSRLAVQAAFDVLEKVARTILNPTTPEQERWEPALLDRDGRSELLGAIASKIVNNWKKRVRRHWDDHPFEADEIAEMGQEGWKWVEARDPHVYGTTLLAGLLLPNLVLLLRKGDGTCMSVFGNADIVDVLPEEDECVGNLTTSMCDADAAQTMQFEILDRSQDDPIAVFVATDGVDKSLAGSDGVANFLRDITCQLVNDVPNESMKKLREALTQLRDDGIGDDASIAGYVDVDRARPCVNALWTQKAFVDLRLEEKRLMRERNSMERRVELARRRQQERAELESQLGRLEVETAEDNSVLEEYQCVNRALDELQIQIAALENSSNVSAGVSTDVSISERIALSLGNIKSVEDARPADGPIASKDKGRFGGPKDVVFPEESIEDSAASRVMASDSDRAYDYDFDVVGVPADTRSSNDSVKHRRGQMGVEADRGIRRGSRKKPPMYLFAIVGVVTALVIALVVFMVALRGGSEKEDVSVEETVSTPQEAVDRPEESNTGYVLWEPVANVDKSNINIYITNSCLQANWDVLRAQMIQRAAGRGIEEDKTLTVADECLSNVKLDMLGDSMCAYDDKYGTYASALVEVKPGDNSREKNAKTAVEECLLVLVKTQDAGDEGWRLCDSEGLAMAVAKVTDFEDRCKRGSETLESDSGQGRQAQSEG